MSRAEFSPATKRLIWTRAGGRCEGYLEGLMLPCKATLEHGCFHYDHIDPDWIGHSNDIANGQLLCIRCHRIKTARDIKTISKIKRIIKKAAGKSQSKRPMPFGRNSKLKKKLNGKVVLR